jgi:hypothetical protein
LFTIILPSFTIILPSRCPHSPPDPTIVLPSNRVGVGSPLHQRSAEKGEEGKGPQPRERQRHRPGARRGGARRAPARCLRRGREHARRQPAREGRRPHPAGQDRPPSLAPAPCWLGSGRGPPLRLAVKGGHSTSRSSMCSARRHRGRRRRGSSSLFEVPWPGEAGPGHRNL